MFEIFIKTTPERLWQAITDPQQRAKYSFGVQTVSEWTAGSPYAAQVPGAGDISSGRPMILSGLKTLLETGELLDTPGSLRYAGPR